MGVVGGWFWCAFFMLVVYLFTFENLKQIRLLAL